ncbi:39S ribosomal protein L44, mitochondrial [Zootermopsis nevadensis]|uniref:Large ribosomal subunit protein mL44 n=2 Tax=Zootermopsis nevadensis TaxID=136037 RepID=A0A067R8Z2_ZOONE|nr:39S ribosomal protein L44, mitochondrial [Zootermopsis nevadensis]
MCKVCVVCIETMAARQTILNIQNLVNPSLLTVKRNYKRWLAPTLKELKRRKMKMGPEPPTRRSAFLEWNYHAELFAFGKRLGEEFRKDLLQRAFTHRSYIVQEEMRQKEVGIEDPKLSLEDNQEFIRRGETLMSEYLKCHLRVALPRFPEEGICAVHGYLMTDKTLAHVSRHLGTKDIILSSDFPVEEVTLATTLKALVGALAESSGAVRAREFVRDFILTQLAGRDINEFWEIKDPMRTLADILKRDGRGEPEPRLINESGRNTILATYQVAVYSDKQFIGLGYGESISIAVEMAAHDALKRLFHTTENMKPIPFTVDVRSMSYDESKWNTSVNDWSSAKVENVDC